MCSSCSPQPFTVDAAKTPPWSPLVKQETTFTLQSGEFTLTNNAAVVSLAGPPRVNGMGKEIVRLRILRPSGPFGNQTDHGTYYKSEIRELIDFLTVVEQQMH